MKRFGNASLSRLAVLLIGLVLLSILAACQSSLPPLTAPEVESAPTATPKEIASAPTDQPEPAQIPSIADVERISVEDTKARFDAGDAVIVDVRSATEYAMGHIPGATHIPRIEIEDRLEELPREAEIILYCT